MVLFGVGLHAAEPGFEAVFSPFEAAFPMGPQRNRVKLAAFDRLVAARGVFRAIQPMRIFESALESVQERIDADYVAYHKVGDQWWGWRRKYERDYLKEHKLLPGEYPVPQALNKRFIDLELALKKSRALKFREQVFQADIVKRVTGLVARCPKNERGKLLAALQAGLKDRNPAQRLRCARLLGLMPGPVAAAVLAGRFSKERQPVVLGALLEARARAEGGDAAVQAVKLYLSNAAWPVREGAIRALRRAGAATAVDALVARLALEPGRLRDDIASALRAMSGTDQEDWAGWWSQARGGWSASPAPLEAGHAVRGAGPDLFFGVQTATRAAIWCLDSSAGWDQVRSEALRGLEALAQGARFGIVVFDSQPRVWRKRPAEAGPATRESARRFLESFRPDGGANAWAGMMAALDLAGARKNKPAWADTIFFAVPRPPREVRTVHDRAMFFEPREVALEITRRNALCGLRIHALGISGPGQANWLQLVTAPYHGTFHALRR